MNPYSLINQISEYNDISRISNDIESLSAQQTSLLHSNNIPRLYEEWGINIGKNLLVLLSGGIDSTVLAGLSKQFFEIQGLQFKRKGMPTIEMDIVDALGAKMDIKINRINYPRGQTESYGLYMLMAAGFGNKNGFENVIVGQVLTDWYNKKEKRIYSGSGLVFNKYINHIISLDKKTISIKSPLGFIAKEDVVLYGVNNNIPLGITISCPYYDKGNKHCGECPQCLERKRYLNDI